MWRDLARLTNAPTSFSARKPKTIAKSLEEEKGCVISPGVASTSWDASPAPQAHPGSKIQPSAKRHREYTSVVGHFGRCRLLYHPFFLSNLVKKYCSCCLAAGVFNLVALLGSGRAAKTRHRGRSWNCNLYSALFGATSLLWAWGTKKYVARGLSCSNGFATFWIQNHSNHLRDPTYPHRRPSSTPHHPHPTPSAFRRCQGTPRDHPRADSPAAPPAPRPTCADPWRRSPWSPLASPKTVGLSFFLGGGGHSNVYVEYLGILNYHVFLTFLDWSSRRRIQKVQNRPSLEVLGVVFLWIQNPYLKEGSLNPNF